MSIYVKNDNGFEHPADLARECPHCGAHAQLLPTATPSYDAIAKNDPRHVGVVFTCSACREPRFARLAVRSIDAERVELSSNFVEVERPRERFAFGYLPDKVERLFREALDCYTADCHNAFASMCRRTIRASMEAVNPHGNPHLYDLFRDVAAITEIDEATAQTLEAVLFDFDNPEPELDAEHSAVLIEIVKDMLQQAFVRTAKLKAAMKMRRFFAGESQNVTPIDRKRAG